jgi:16S rRNA (adenine1518-N6/adenine1519-N6)-dimethyltransferase
MNFCAQNDLPCYDSAAAIKSFLDSRSLAAHKKFGQNFLLNAHARTTLINALDLDGGAPVWEVGPGLGVMTRLILEKGANLTAFEIDKGFCSLLRQMFSLETDQKKFSLAEGDALKTLLKKLCEIQKDGRSVIPVRLFGNLPYNIAAALIAKTIESGVRFCRAVVTVQKEVAERMTSLPGSKDYSSFSVLCSWAYSVKKIADFPGSFFWPSPAVDSRALLLLPNGNFTPDIEAYALTRIVRAAFSSRRKTIKNNLLALCGSQTETLLESCGINPQTRAENLCVKDFLKLARLIKTN